MAPFKLTMDTLNAGTDDATIATRFDRGSHHELPSTNHHLWPSPSIPRLGSSWLARLASTALEPNPDNTALLRTTGAPHASATGCVFPPLRRAIKLKVFTNEKFGQSIAIIETDHQTFSPSAKKKNLERLGLKDEAEEDGLDPAVFGHTRSEPGKILNPSTGETTFKLDLEHNEAAFSLAVLNFAVDAGELFLAVGTASDLTLAPKSLASGFIYIYKFVNDGLGLEFVHKTAVEDILHALPSFPGSYLGRHWQDCPAWANASWSANVRTGLSLL
ncbi:MAG: hypothetical protein J3Q66DRAFT_432218 [Benniella sp.]|nr:MAG: hypothetical protein J3Q66DRAFT_432218 [Benniella sp.]